MRRAAPSSNGQFQPRLGIAWDVDGDGRQVVRGSAGLYYARIPGINLASTRSTNGSTGQTMFRNSNLISVLGAPQAYDQLLPAPSGTPFRPDVFVTDKDFRNPRTMSASAGYEREIATGTAASVSYTSAAPTSTRAGICVSRADLPPYVRDGSRRSWRSSMF